MDSKSGAAANHIVISISDSIFFFDAAWTLLVVERYSSITDKISFPNSF
jgi:hypothetical protein